ncbi:MAG: sulfite exporter TauE/SafE family protein [Ignavibacteriae bacterium]|nr:sulfite exporter TauE/SafE family protein [Ignavibacteriota bacterium]NOG97212.1 sulfite exporter TauE/SafE family protein [Ignavibacteriota bacterium]
MEMEIWAGFAIGLVGSFHCVGMCGPIALALPAVFENNFQLMLSRVLYNLGRVITYALFGAVLGLFSNRIIVIGLQQYTSIILGVIIVLYVITPRRYKAKLSSTKIYSTIYNSIKKGFNKVTKSKSTKSFLLIGIINGFLPCGLVYVALAGALSSGSVISGAIFMTFFGLGTFPIMFITSVAGKYLNVGVRRRINKLVPVFAFILGVIFILRGLNLGIPYISPPLKNFAKPGTEMMMHH